MALVPNQQAILQEFNGKINKDNLDPKLAELILSDADLETFIKSLFPFKYGNTSVNFSASTVSEAKEVSHELGVKPSSVVITGLNLAGNFPTWNVYEVNETTFKVKGQLPGVGSGAAPFSWTVFK